LNNPDIQIEEAMLKNGRAVTALRLSVVVSALAAALRRCLIGLSRQSNGWG
jgi:hypothetical protein